VLKCTVNFYHTFSSMTNHVLHKWPPHKHCLPSLNTQAFIVTRKDHAKELLSLFCQRALYCINYTSTHFIFARPRTYYTSDGSASPSSTLMLEAATYSKHCHISTRLEGVTFQTAVLFSYLHSYYCKNCKSHWMHLV
jgi:hypothetical protein